MKRKRKINYETRMSFLAAGDNTYTRVSWEPGNVTAISEFLIALANGNAFQIMIQQVEQYGESIGDIEGLEEIKNNLVKTIGSNNSPTPQEDSEEPVVPPISAIHHMLTMFGNNINE